jgi:hypothetical protein
MLQSVFSAEELDTLARITKFVQRSSKLSPEKFLDVLIKDASLETGMSLLGYSNELCSTHGVSISAQGIDDRFNDYAVKFMRQLVSNVFDKQVGHSFEDAFLQMYSSVHIFDSTKLELPADMRVDFPGFGGDASEAGISIQYRYDLKNRVGCSLDVYPATFSDSKYTQEISLEENSLEIFDLGYVSADFLMRFNKELRQHYVCRLHSQSCLYDISGNELNLKKIYRWMRLYRIPFYEVNVLVGEKRFPSRLVINLVDEQTYQKRLSKIKKEGKKKGWQVSDQYKLRLRMNLMLTNSAPEEIPASKVYLLYKFRWQVELFFKNWKSSGWNLDKIKDVKYERYMCLLYAKLLMIILSDQIYGFFAHKQYQRDKKLLSPTKCVKTLCQQIDLLRKLINAGVNTIKEALEKIGELFSRGHILCKRKGRTNYFDLFHIFVCKEN